MRPVRDMSDVLGFDSWCRRCTGYNPCWVAPSPLWNAVMREHGGGPEKFSGIVCPGCFVQLAQEAGIAEIWRLYTPDPQIKLELTDREGWIWDQDTWLYRMPVEAVTVDPSLLAHQLVVLTEIAAEREAQDARWGQQNHKDGTAPDRGWVGAGFAERVRNHPMRDDRDYFQQWAKDRCASLFAGGQGTWEAILTEEWAEVVAEADEAKLRKELIQLAAVAVAWIEAIDRRTEEGESDGVQPASTT